MCIHGMLLQACCISGALYLATTSQSRHAYQSMLCAAASNDASDASSYSDGQAQHVHTDRTQLSNEDLWREGNADGSASNNGGLWQRGNAEPSQEGTWDFDTGPSKSPSQSAAAGHPTAALHTSSEKQMLYIQMEFCPRTLKQALLAGPIEEADAWQVGCSCCASCCAMLARHGIVWH